MAFVKKAADSLEKLLPDRKILMAGNAESMLAGLRDLQAQAAGAMAAIPSDRRVVLVGHNAFAYFGKAYGLEFDAPEIVAPPAVADADLDRLAALVDRRGLAKLFRVTPTVQEQEETLHRLVDLAASKYRYGARIAGPLYGDSLAERGTPAGTYAGAFRINVRLILEAAGAPVPPAFALLVPPGDLK